MLTKVRIEVEEQTVGEVVDALARYEHAIQCAEAQRYEAQWPAEFAYEPGKDAVRTGPSSFSSWGMDMGNRDFFDGELGRDLLEEVIEYDSGLPAWRGRRVVRYARLDTRSESFLPVTSGDTL